MKIAAGGQSEELSQPIGHLIEEWDKAADALEHDRFRPHRYAKCFRYFDGIPKRAKILEVGCGEGTGLLTLRTLGFDQLFGVEVSCERLQRAAAKLGGDVRLELVEPEKRLPFEDDSFDVVISAAVIEHTLDYRKFIKELARVAKDGGLVVISSDCFSWRILQVMGIYQSVQPIDKAEFPLKLVKEFRKANLRLLDCEGFPLPGEEYRFLRLLGTGLLSIAKRTIARAFGTAAADRLKRLLSAFVRGARPETSSKDKSKDYPPQDFEPIVLSARPTTKPSSRLLLARALPGLIFSDENVFCLRK